MIVPPPEVDSERKNIYSAHFGDITTSSKKMELIRKQAFPNVPIYCWLEFKISENSCKKFTLFKKFTLNIILSL